MRARGRIVAVLAHLVGGALILAGSVLVWATVVPADAPSVELDGTTVAPALAPVALTLGALGLALTIASPIVARVLAILGVAVVGIGATHLAQRVATLGDTIADAASAATGVTTLDAASTTTAAPALAVVGLVLALASAVWAFVTAPHWQRRQAQQRFERAESGLAWDALDDGEDPTASGRADERGTHDR
ncbi:Trp biosynthesis-associated membrane protein [Agrococcus jejuensis]|uniref:Tryptophan-associated transmembrane protein (Trp_oprn_chp) n=1 Tax=Agrococcus jejuensis TaxID=399736 RepID=A0A1G7ZP36_9MICO|nr:Trp biosynthesis-associated membrane protein [Agrococcus jejuensis]SDH10429.1 Tryptophan-associated transmembrane protein (Trp_oprn_chp) [Agrococcus jejuensis]